MLAAHIMITGTNNLNIVTMSANLIVFFIILYLNISATSIFCSISIFSGMSMRKVPSSSL